MYRTEFWNDYSKTWDWDGGPDYDYLNDAEEVIVYSSKAGRIVNLKTGEIIVPAKQA